MDESQFRRIRPGLYERVNTPRRVTFSGPFVAAIRESGSPLLVAILEHAIKSETEGSGG